MKIDVVMPKMGESIMEGTVLKWHKKVGDKIAKDENLLDIATDKVDAEVPATESGVVAELLFNEGDVVEVGKAIARIETDASVNIQSPLPITSIQSTPAHEPAPVSAPIPSVISNETLINVVMPKMGESIMEGTVLKWHKKVGDKIAKDENLLDIATDKVDAEVPATKSGVVAELLFKEGDVVEVGKVIAKISTSGAVISQSSASATVSSSPASAPIAAPQASPVSAPPKSSQVQSNRFYSPVVMSIAAEKGISMNVLETIPGSGSDNRVTKKDLLEFLEKGGKGITVVSSQAPAPSSRPSTSHTPTVTFDPSQSQIIPMDNMRKAIAEHMIRSKQTSAHVTSVSEVDVTGLMKLISIRKKSFEENNGVKLTLTPFFVDAVVKALKVFPMLNSSVDGTNIVLKKYINVGIAVALGEKGAGGLIVPVIKNADSKNIIGLAKSVQDLAGRSRSKKLMPDELQGGTFTITNYGVTGNLFGSPIINQPQVAILGTGAVVKRPIVKTIDGTDSITIRSMMYISLSYDHRIVDGAQAGYFLQELVSIFEGYNENTSF